MEKVAIMVDAFADIPKEWISEWNIHIIPSVMHLGEKEFNTRDCTSEEVLKYFEKTNQLPVIDPTTTEMFSTQFISLIHRGYHIIYLATFAKFNKSYNSSLVAAEVYPDKIAVVDTGTMTTGVAPVVYTVHKLIQEENSYKDIVSGAERAISRSCVNFLFPNDKLALTNAGVGMFGQTVTRLFNIRQRIDISGGNIKQSGMLRGKIEAIIPKFVNDVLNHQEIDDEILIIGYSKMEKAVLNQIVEEIKKYVAFKEIVFAPATATATMNLGIGGISLAYNLKK